MNIEMMETAFLVSQKSTCCSYRVGCVIEKDGIIISTGFNGVPRGKKTCCEHAYDEKWLIKNGASMLHSLDQNKRPLHSEWSSKNEVHAEINAIMNCAKNGVSLLGANMWCTASPCPDCAKAIANSGISKLYYCDGYDRGAQNWKDILEGLVEVEQVSRNELRNVNFDKIKTQFFEFFI